MLGQERKMLAKEHEKRKTDDVSGPERTPISVEDRQTLVYRFLGVFSGPNSGFKEFPPKDSFHRLLLVGAVGFRCAMGFGCVLSSWVGIEPQPGIPILG